MVRAFRGAKPEAQCFVLQTMYHANEFEQSGQDCELDISQPMVLRKWQLCGKQVCVTGFCHIFGMTRRSLYKKVRGIPDKRSLPQCRSIPKTSNVDLFFRQLYESAAEPIPNEWKTDERAVDPDKVSETCCL